MSIHAEVLMQFEIRNMGCGGCARSITKVIQSIDPAATVEADPGTKQVHVRSDKPREALATALTKAGYPPTDAY